MTPDSHSSRRVVWTVVAACLAVFSSYVPLTAVGVALTPIGHGLHLSTSDVTWVLDFLVVPMAAFILSAGTLGDLIGRRRVLLGGLVLVVIGSGLGLASGSSLELLFAAQATLGTAAAVLLPSSLAVISHAIPDPARRAGAVAVWASSLAVALAVGPWLTALVINGFGARWQWLYAALLPWPLLALAISARHVQESKAPAGRGFDLPGQIAAGLLMVAVVYGVIQAPGHGWGSTLVLASFAVAAVALVALVIVERRVRAPMLPRALFACRAFSVAGVVVALLMFALVGALFVLVLFFGSVQQLGVSQLALRLLLLFGTLALTGPLAARAAQRLGARAILTIGLLVGAGGLLSLLGVAPQTTLGGVWWRLALIGGGVGIVLAPVTATAVASAPPALAGLAGTANNAIRQTGSALGPAVLGAILTSRLVSQLPTQLAGALLTLVLLRDRRQHPAAATAKPAPRHTAGHARWQPRARRVPARPANTARQADTRPRSQAP